MKILELFNKDKSVITGVWQELIDANDCYTVSVMHLGTNTKTNVCGDISLVQTFYVIEGEVEATVFDQVGQQEFGRKIYSNNKGWSLLPEQKQSLHAKHDSLIFVVSGKIFSGKLTDVTGKNPIKLQEINDLGNYLVNKPWGSEQWFVENGIYVLKGITMNSGEKCSLQVHENKIEVNLVLHGSAEVMLCYDKVAEEAIVNHRQSGKQQSEFVTTEEILSSFEKNKQSILIGKYEGWKVRPFQIHQVFSKETYFALEVSTTEVDDIIRLQDKHNRPGGRIVSEHQNV
jgi:hypothetical protein